MNNYLSAYTYGNCQCLIDRCHKAIRQTADVFFQPQLVDGSDLLCKGGRIVFEQFRYLTST